MEICLVESGHTCKYNRFQCKDSVHLWVSKCKYAQQRMVHVGAAMGVGNLQG